MMAGFVDVHTHLTHEKFDSFREQLFDDLTTEMSSVICNGLEPVSNRKILEWSKTFLL